MTPEEITAAEAELAWLNTKNQQLRVKIQDMDNQLSNLAELRNKLAEERRILKLKYGDLYEDVGIAKKELARLAETAKG